MFVRFYSVAKNTLIETLRQPIFVVIIIFALFLMFMAPSISMYTLDEDIKLLRELGLSTLFLAGLFIAVFSATGAVTEEIETGTITTVLSKPISRPVFILGKFFGIAAAVTVAHLLITMAFIMVTRHGVLETASDTVDWTVVAAAGGAIALTLLITAFLNYAYDWNFAATGVLFAVLFFGIGVVFLFFVDREWKFNPADNRFESFDIIASVLLLFAVYLLVALAVLFSTRLNEVLTLTFTVGAFLLGLISDYIFGRFAAESIWAWVAAKLTPNLQIFWVSDAIYETGVVPAQYLLHAASYTVLYIAGILALAVALFQRRQVG